MAHHLRFRQIHLDFHTSPAIPGIGSAFDKAEWQKTLKEAHVNSITLFAKCHHGWHYNNTKVGQRHPNLNFDLLRAQFDACKEINVNAPIYLSAGYDTRLLDEHPEWAAIHVDPETLETTAPLTQEACFQKICFNSSYVDFLCDEIREVMHDYPNSDGIFLDIIYQAPCHCPACMKIFHEHGWDPHNPEDLQKVADIGLERYYRMTTAAVRDIDPNMPIFHNSGHITPGKRDVLNKYFSHLELESLPTGGWGYDHFALSAKYAHNLPFDYLGMTGKFHTTWGEFGGYKHPNALRYECAAMLAFGAKSSIGDQLHPNGRLDPSTYRIIGRAYKEVEEKEPWCDNVHNVAEIALLSKAAAEGSASRELLGDIGAGRVLLEGHFLFDIIDLEMDFSMYKLIVMPDDIAINSSLKAKLDDYLAQGGRLLLSYKSGLDAEGKPLFDFGAEFEGQSPFSPDYILPRPDLQATDVDSPMVMYLPGERLRVTTGSSLGDIYDPYFNRTDHDHFCSHQHTPYKPEPTGYACGVQKGQITYLAHQSFSIYKGWGSVPLAEFLRKVILLALGGTSRLNCNLPSTGRISVMDQPAENRSVIHLLYANTVPRGGDQTANGVGILGNGIVIEDLMPLRGTKVSFKAEKAVKRVVLQPQGIEIPFQTADDGTVSFAIDEFTCHQMVVLEY